MLFLFSCFKSRRMTRFGLLLSLISIYVLYSYITGIILLSIILLQKYLALYTLLCYHFSKAFIFLFCFEETSSFKNQKNSELQCFKFTTLQFKQWGYPYWGKICNADVLLSIFILVRHLDWETSCCIQKEET